MFYKYIKFKGARKLIIPRLIVKNLNTLLSTTIRTVKYTKEVFVFLKIRIFAVDNIT